MSKGFRLSGFRGRADLPSTAGGWRASEAAREWFAENRYQDYLYLHGLSVEMAEALAEYVHKRIRGDWALPPTRPATPKRCLAIVVHHPQAK
jgi:cobalamin-dependent methionine synthase I